MVKSCNGCNELASYMHYVVKVRKKSYYFCTSDCLLLWSAREYGESERGVFRE